MRRKEKLKNSAISVGADKIMFLISVESLRENGIWDYTDREGSPLDSNFVLFWFSFMLFQDFFSHADSSDLAMFN